LISQQLIGNAPIYTSGLINIVVYYY